jgi:predicted DNA-binding transcriptional regulator AlpA
VPLPRRHDHRALRSTFVDIKTLTRPGSISWGHATGIVEMSRRPQPGSGARNNYTSANFLRAALPTVLDVPQAARLLGIGRTLAYELVRTDQWPTPVIRVGRLIRIPSGPLIELMSTGYPTNTAAG